MDVAVRDLKAKLSAYLQQAAAGERITVTDRGRPFVPGVEIAGKKYKIEVKDKDDEYNASKTVQNINELAGTDGDKAFAIFNVVGTANNIAIREAMGENCVPNVFAATG